MANKRTRINNGQKEIFEVDSDPSTGGGTSALIGSLALLNAAGAGSVWIKTAAANTAWSQLSTGGGGFATIALDNLSSTSINAALDPDSDNVRSLGNTGARWAEGYFVSLNDSSAVIVLDVSNRTLVSPGGSPVFDWSGASIVTSLDITPDTAFGRSLGSAANPFDTVRLATLALFDSDASDSVQISAAGTTTGYSLTLPPAQGAAGETLVNDGGGNLSWATASSSAIRSDSGTITVSATTDRTIIVDNSGASATVNLPAGVDGLEYFIDGTSAATVNTITIVADGTDTIQTGITTAGSRLFAGAVANSAHIQFLGGNWYVLSYVMA